MQVETINITDIKAYENNAKLHPAEQIEQIKKSIMEFGNNDPIAIDENNVIIEGHGRYIALKELGFKEVEVIRLEHLTEEQKKAYMLVHNKLTMNTDFDIELLSEELSNILDIDMGEFGFDLLEEEKTFIEVEEDEYEENTGETRTKRGDIYKLGENYLMCGDSCQKADVEKLMRGKEADFVFLDPPYDMEEDSWTENLTFAKKGNPIFLMASDKQTLRLANKIPNFRHFFIHDRKSAVMLNSYMPMSRHTIISYFCERPSEFFINLKDYFTTIIECNKNYKDSEEKNYNKMGKPIHLISKFIQHYSQEQDVVLDLFGGGGSVLISCQELNRICYTMELDEKACDTIIDRWEAKTGQKAELIT